KDQGLVIVSLSDEPAETINEFNKKAGMDWIIGAGSSSGRDYGVSGIPTAFVVVDGKIVWNGHPMGGLEEEVKKQLEAKGAKAPAAPASSEAVAAPTEPAAVETPAPAAEPAAPAATETPAASTEEPAAPATTEEPAASAAPAATETPAPAAEPAASETESKPATEGAAAPVGE
ncbi:MAG TPA: hypothetical protein PLR50_05030, partial [Candidatus Rifleibacterium sp.]|nr:hypothetical protein [Candidatus Rifleibacterium sp.]